jgi:predicted transcriptional regulator
MLAKEKAYVDEIAAELELDENNVAWALRILKYFEILKSKKERVGRVYKTVYMINEG